LRLATKQESACHQDELSRQGCAVAKKRSGAAVASEVLANAVSRARLAAGIRVDMALSNPRTVVKTCSATDRGSR
jgi:hypothetical protein